MHTCNQGSFVNPSPLSYKLASPEAWDGRGPRGTQILQPCTVLSVPDEEMLYDPNDVDFESIDQHIDAILMSGIAR